MIMPHGDHPIWKQQEIIEIIRQVLLSLGGEGHDENAVNNACDRVLNEAKRRMGLPTAGDRAD